MKVAAKERKQEKPKKAMTKKKGNLLIPKKLRARPRRKANQGKRSERKKKEISLTLKT